MSHLTIFARSIRLISLPALLLFVTGCGPAKVMVEGDFPVPLMEPIPVTMGVWYNQDFVTHEFFDKAKSRRESDWLVATGTAQVEMWDTLLAGMFQEVVSIDAAPAGGKLQPLTNAVLIPHVEELQYAIPSHTNIKVYEIWIRYRFELVTPEGEPIAEWAMTAYGKTPTAFLRSDEASVNMAAVMALRDAGANFATSFTRVPEVQVWMDNAAGAATPEKTMGSQP